MKNSFPGIREKDKGLETHFTAGLLQINFANNALILLAYIYFVVSESLYAIKDPFIQFSVWEVIAFDGDLTLRSNLCPLCFPIFLSSFMGSAGGLASNSKKLRKKLSRSGLFEDRGGQRKERDKRR